MNHFQLIVIKRIDDHKAAEAKRIEAERDRIRAEEAAKLATQAPSAPTAAPTNGAAPPAVQPAPTLAASPRLNEQQLRALINASLADMTVDELQRSLDAIHAVIAERQHRRSA